MGTLLGELKSRMSWAGDTIARTEVSYELGWGYYKEN